MRKQKGITLVALIITIVVLLILAVVSITAVYEQDIITQTNDVKDKWQGAMTNESGNMTYWNSQMDAYYDNYINE